MSRTFTNRTGEKSPKKSRGNNGKGSKYTLKQRIMDDITKEELKNI